MEEGVGGQVGGMSKEEELLMVCDGKFVISHEIRTLISLLGISSPSPMLSFAPLSRRLTREEPLDQNPSLAVSNLSMSGRSPPPTIFSTSGSASPNCGPPSTPGVGDPTSI